MIKSLLYYLLALQLVGCASAHSLTQAGFQPTEAPAMPFTTPISAIGSIQRGNQVVFDSAATRASVGLLRRQLRAQQAGLRLSGELVIPDSLRLQAEQEIGRAVAALNSRPQLGGGANLPVLDYLLQQQGQRYVFVTAARGFTRSPSNYGGQVAKSIGVGLLTMGMLVPVSVMARSEIGVFVYDAQQRAIVYYCHTPPVENEPLDETSVAKQLRTMLAKDYTFAP